MTVALDRPATDVMPTESTAAAVPLLDVRDVRVDYGRIHALMGVDLRVEAGQIVSLIGANGAGKTTTLMALSGLLPLAGGTVWLAGHDITGMASELRVERGLAHVPERRRLFAGMTVRENLVLGAYRRRDQRAVADDLDRLTTLFPILGRRLRQTAGTLSGGEQQMLAIARALMSRPRLLVMDEPTMGLAPQIIDVILDTVLEVRRQGVTVLLVEQNAIEAIRLSDHVYVMRLGRIVHEDTGAGIDTERVKALYMGNEL